MVKEFDNTKILETIQQLKSKVEELEEQLEEKDIESELNERYHQGYDDGLAQGEGDYAESVTSSLEAFQAFAEEILGYDCTATVMKKFIEATISAQDFEDLPTKKLDLV